MDDLFDTVEEHPIRGRAGAEGVKLAVVRRYAGQIARAHGHPTPSVVLTQGATRAVSSGGRDRIHLNADELAEGDLAAARFAVARQTGHILLGHTRSRVVPAAVGTGVVTAALSLLAFMWVGVASWGNPLLQNAAVPALLLVLGGLVAGVHLLGAHVLAPRERAADRFALAAGAVITPAMVAAGTAGEAEGAAGLARLLCPGEPTWAERAAAQQDLAPRTS